MDRAYSVLTVKAVDEDARLIEGIATTPTPDRMGDIVEPEGASYSLPLPLLWQHDHAKPVGTVDFAEASSKGIKFRAKLAKVAEAGALRDRVEEAWQTLKAGLVRGVSIGFNPTEYSFMEESGGLRFRAWEWLELSLVTVPANAEATISTIKSLDAKARAATGRDEPKAPKVPAAASGDTVKAKPEKRKMAKKQTLAEQISAFKDTRAEKSARMAEIMEEAEGSTLDASQAEEFEELEAEIEQIDAHVKRLRSLQKAQAETAKTVDGDSQEKASASRGGDERDVRGVIHARAKAPKAAPGIEFARLAKVKAIAKLDSEPALGVAERMYGAESPVVGLIKAAVVAGSTASGNWASALVGDETSAYADFVSYLRPATIMGKFGVSPIPALRSVPFREPLISQTGGGAAYWVGEGKPKPLTAFDFERTTIEPLKIANIAVLTEENIRSSAPSSEMIVRDALRDAIAAGMDTAFIDPANAGSAGVKPASITNGAAAIASTGTDADAIRLDVRALFQKFIDANNPPSSGVWIMSSTNALSLSLMVNALGQREFPNMSMSGGVFEGLPAIVSDYAGTTVALVNASDIYEADEGGIAVDMSREASLEMKDSSLTQDATAGTGVAMVSLWQSNLVGLRAERTINWKRRRSSAVAYLTGVAWGGAVPAS